MKIAIAGGGLAGLAAAASLIDRAEVTIFEKSKALGGRASTAHKAGYVINQGPHALYAGGAAYKFLADQEIAPVGWPPDVSGSKGYFKKQLSALPTGLSSLIGTRMLSISEKFQLASVFQTLAKVDTNALSGTTVKQWLDEHTKSLSVRSVVEAFIRLSTYSNSPDKMSAGAAFAQMNLASKGVLYLDNGWEVMVESLTEKIRGKVEIRLESDINELSNIEAFDATILAIPPDAVSHFLKNHSADRFSEDLGMLSKILPTKAACLDVCLRKLPDQAVTFALGIDESLYFSVHSASAKLAPEGGALLHAAYYLEAGQNGGDAHRRKLEAFLDQIQTGWREQLVYDRFLPNMISNYGCATAVNDGHQGFASPELNGSKNIFVCGDWVGKGHMLLDAAISSAVEAASLSRQLVPV